VKINDEVRKAHVFESKLREGGITGQQDGIDDYFINQHFYGDAANTNSKWLRVVIACRRMMPI
jgi:hypothetical protein